MHGEFGHGDSGLDFCDDQHISYAKQAIFGAFTGQAASGMDWAYQENEGNVFQYLGPIADFMAGIPLNEENWYPLQDEFEDGKIELMYLRNSEDQIKATGVLSNRTFNYYTQHTDDIFTNLNGDTIANCSNLGQLDSANFIQFNSPNLITSESFLYDDALEIKLPNMGFQKQYKIDWYNALTGAFVGTVSQTSGISNNLELHFPNVLSGDIESPILLFQIYRAGEIFKQSELNSTNQNESNKKQINFDDKQKGSKFKLYPNPTQDKLYIEISNGSFEDVSIQIFGMDGKDLSEIVVTDQKVVLDLTNYEDGPYVIKIITKDEQKRYKIIKK